MAEEAGEIARYWRATCGDGDDAASYAMGFTGTAEQLERLRPKLTEVECMFCGERHPLREISAAEYAQVTADADDELGDDDWFEG